MVHLCMTGHNRKKVLAAFYRSQSGNEPVREWFLERSREDRKAIGGVLNLVGLSVCRYVVLWGWTV